MNLQRRLGSSFGLLGGGSCGKGYGRPKRVDLAYIGNLAPIGPRGTDLGAGKASRFSGTREFCGHRDGRWDMTQGVLYEPISCFRASELQRVVRLFPRVRKCRVMALLHRDYLDVSRHTFSQVFRANETLYLRRLLRVVEHGTALLEDIKGRGAMGDSDGSVGFGENDADSRDSSGNSLANADHAYTLSPEREQWTGVMNVHVVRCPGTGNVQLRLPLRLWLLHSAQVAVLQALLRLVVGQVARPLLLLRTTEKGVMLAMRSRAPHGVRTLPKRSCRRRDRRWRRRAG